MAAKRPTGKPLGVYDYNTKKKQKDEILDETANGEKLKMLQNPAPN